MESLLGFGLVWTIYGWFGFMFGWQIIPEECKGKPWTSEYARFRGLSWLLMGIPWLVLYGIFSVVEVSFPVRAFLMVVCAAPSLLYSVKKEKKFKKLLEEEKESP